MEYLIGIILGFVIVLGAKLTGFHRDKSFYPVLLIVIATYYVLFAAMDGSAVSLIIESTIALVFILVALLGIRYGVRLVAAGLILHGVFDFVHGQLVVNTAVPVWWPGFCASVDIVLGALVLYLTKTEAGKRMVPEGEEG